MNKYKYASSRTGAVLAILFAGYGASADVVQLNDGSRLVGTIEQVADGKLWLVTDFAGKLEIEIGKIKSFGSEGKMNVALKSGDRLVGKVTQSPDGTKSAVDSVIGSAGVTSDQISAVWPEGKSSPEQVAAEKAIEAAKPKWTATLEGGIVATEGNTDTLTGRARGELIRKSQTDLFKLYASADYSEQNDVRNRSEYIAGGRYESSFPTQKQPWGGPYFWYARTEFEYDEFENLDLRATMAAGIGHYWLQKEHHEFTTRGGAGYRHQAYMDGTSTDDPILDTGFDYRYDIREWASFTHSTVFSPSLEDFSEYRLTLDTALAFPIGKSERWKYKMGVRNDYNSDPQPGRDRLDNTYYANILLEFK
ncbi:MAG: DUF481 domain-containing protein [Planctomycetota bacterium]